MNTTDILLDTFRSTPDILNGLLRNVSQEQAAAARGGDENWSVVQVLCHLRDAEERNLERIRLMRNQDNPVLEGYDQEQWARERNYAAARLDEALAAFLKRRAATLAELKTLAPQEWERPGLHSEAGPITVLSHLQRLLRHDAIHLAQIARQLTE
ncbi:MAG: DinB family protein [Anaerolineales bacterium]